MPSKNVLIMDQLFLDNITRVDTYRGNTEIYGVLEKSLRLAQYDIFFKDLHIFLYYHNCLHKEFILWMILPVYQLKMTIMVFKL